MIVPVLLFTASCTAFAAAFLVPGYDAWVLLAMSCLLASLYLIAAEWIRRKAAPKTVSPRRARRRPASRPADPGPARRSPVAKSAKTWPARRSILVDGSNVLHWRDNTPQIATVRQVIDLLTAQGFAPGVVFDATVGYKIGDRYRDDAAMAACLGLAVDRVLVVPKGTQADPVLLATARALDAAIVTNDRFRDWAEAHPEVRHPGHLIRGGYTDGKLWLDPLEPADVAAGAK